ncbi:MAG: hypothetical protein Q8922_01400 [Bacteroidota bacterium]|nr:hypothetical protein [Bacteroidota bacterium]MDP4232117.1 hypothetical protein [Bacteroidota bacterium]MDP4241175.1 hypothetical protein [Bacteroidota bacterium]MDP4286567.1 hypothetical protein [Bacteroidota bacterium]
MLECSLAHAQGTRTPTAAVRKIFREYVQCGQEESMDLDENKEAMRQALVALKETCQRKDLPLLINVWMYYDPTDFPTDSLIRPVFFEHRADSLASIGYRLKHRKKWERHDDWAPISDLIELKKELSK